MLKRIRWYIAVIIIIASPLALADITDFDNIVIIHHSVGNNLINRGGIRSRVATYNSQNGTSLEFWDHDRNNSGGLRDERGYPTGMNYNIPQDDTDPDGLRNMFVQPIHNPPDNAMSYFMLPHEVNSEIINHEVIIYKSCFTAALIYSDQVLQNYRNWHLEIRDVVDQHPEKLFIAFTIPPRAIDDGTTPEMGARLRAFNEWLASPEYWSGHPNLYVFDFWTLLVEHDPSSPYYDCLRQIYQGAPVNSHPNQLADQTNGPIFFDFMINAIEAYSSGEQEDNQAPLVNVVSPNGGEVWEIGTAHNINWNSFDNIGVVEHKIEYSSNNGADWQILRDWISGNPNSFGWTLPNLLSDQLLVKISCRDSAGNEGSDQSNSAFTIDDLTLPSVEILNPIDGDYADGDTIEIEWQAQDNGNLVYNCAEYTIDEGDSWLPIFEDNGDSTGIYAWPKPTAVSAFWLRMSFADEADNLAADTVHIIPNGIIDSHPGLPSEFGLSPAYPNPFNTSVTIAYQLPANSQVRLEIYDMLGNLVTRLVNEYQPAGSYQTNWRADEMPSGLYLYRLQAGNLTEIKKMTLLK